MHFIKALSVALFAASTSAAAVISNVEARQKAQCDDARRSLALARSAFQIITSTLPPQSQENAWVRIREFDSLIQDVRRICNLFEQL